jgi:ribosomal protein S18 acetylase RimI-like enzyme
MVEVHPDYRRQGIATAMWQYAKAQGLNPTHELIKTEDGYAWSQAVGD